MVSRRCRLHVAGGMEDHLHTLSAELASRGHEVLVVTSRHPEGHRSQSSDGVEWRYLDAAAGDEPAWSRSLIDVVRELRAGAAFDVIHSQSTAAGPLLTHGEPGLPPIVLCLHGNYGSIVSTTVRLALRRPSPRAIARSLVDLASLTRLHLRGGYWRAFSGCEATVPSRSQVRGSCVSHRLRADHVHVVLSGIDADLFRPHPDEDLRERLGLPDAPLLLAAGRLDRGKGTEVAVDALALLDDFPTARLLVLGSGPRQAAIESLAAHRGVRDRLDLLGHRPLADVARYMAAADVFVFPTLLAEAGPLVVPQALACGTPVVGSSIGAVPEMLGGSGETGLLAHPGSAAAFAAALRTLLADAGLRATLGARGRERVLAHMTIQRMADRMLDVYERAAAASPGR